MRMGRLSTFVLAAGLLIAGVAVAQRDGDAAGERGPRDGEAEARGPRDGDRGPRGPRDGDGPPRGPRDGERGPRGPRDGEGQRGRPPGPPPNPLMEALDTDKDGEISAEEINNAAAALKKLDKNDDGKLTGDEVRPPRPPRGMRDGDRPPRGDGDRPQRGDGDRPPRPKRDRPAPPESN